MKKSIFSALCLVLLATTTQSAWGQDVFYTFQTVQSASNTAYTRNYDVTINDLNWSVPGNQNFDGYVRIGGKSLSNTARSITAKNAMASAISKITVSHNGKSNASLTVNKVTLTVASDANFSNVIETITLTPTIAATTAGSFDFTPASGSWATNSYYKITFTLTNSKSSNYGVDLTKMEFYSAGTSSTTLYLGQEMELFWNPARRFAVFGTPPVASLLVPFKRGQCFFLRAEAILLCGLPFLRGVPVGRRVWNFNFVRKTLRFLEPHPSLRSSSP